jgi:hypothetical protein
MRRYKKISIAINTAFLAVWIIFTALCLTFNTIAGYFLSALFLGLSGYGGYYLYRILWLYNWGRPLSEDKKRKRDQMRKQMQNYKRYNLYHRLYRFADATEDEYQAEKTKEILKKIHR